MVKDFISRYEGYVWGSFYVFNSFHVISIKINMLLLCNMSFTTYSTNDELQVKYTF
jgi:hypothetical protein